MIINKDNEIYNDLHLDEDLIINGSRNVFRGLVVSGRIIVLGSYNIFDTIRFSGEDGMTIYKESIGNEIKNGYFINLDYALTIYGRDNDISDSLFSHNKTALLMIGSKNRIVNNQIYSNKLGIVDKGTNRYCFNVLRHNENGDIENVDSNYVLS